MKALSTKKDLVAARDQIEKEKIALYKDGVGATAARQKEDELAAQEVQIKNLKPVKLTLAFEPDSIFLGVLTDWVKRRFGTDYFLDLTVARTILGGVIVEAQGRYWDFSLKKVFEAKTKGSTSLN